MLTGEVAYGKNPFLAVQICDKIICEAEQRMDYETRFEGLYTYSPAISDTADILGMVTSSSLSIDEAKVICIQTWDGSTVLQIAKMNPRNSIIAICDNEATARWLSLIHGVYSFYFNISISDFSVAMNKAMEHGK
jgi:pyruvate kinase